MPATNGAPSSRFSTLLCSRRGALGLSRHDLARAIGADARHIEYLENRPDQMPQPGVLADLARALRVPLPELLEATVRRDWES
jgi:transcriptional regulator with XRE-family HTH domain